MKLATFNLENLFERPAIMNLDSDTLSQQVLKDYFDLSTIFEKEQYSQADKDLILKLMKKYDGLLEEGRSDYIILNEIRGHLLNKEHTSVESNGRSNWIGWCELTRATIAETAIENTGRVIASVNADVLSVVEIEDRVALNHFNESVLPIVNAQPYSHTLVIDGNDNRGIDVGIMTKSSFDVKSIATHIDDVESQEKIFSRDCAEYTVTTPAGNSILLLVNHLKSQRGERSESDRIRKRQAKRIREIYEERLSQGIKFIVVIGDLNIHPNDDSLQPLLSNESSLVEVMRHPKFISDGFGGTYRNSGPKNKLDYILMSPEIFNKVKKAGIERRGVWGGEDGTLFPHFPEITKELDAASDHAVLWVDLDI